MSDVLWERTVDGHAALVDLDDMSELGPRVPCRLRLRVRATPDGIHLYQKFEGGLTLACTRACNEPGVAVFEQPTGDARHTVIDTQDLLPNGAVPFSAGMTLTISPDDGPAPAAAPGDLCTCGAIQGPCSCDTRP